MKEYEAAPQNQPVDVSEEFAKQQNHFFVGSKVSAISTENFTGLSSRSGWPDARGG